MLPRDERENRRIIGWCGFDVQNLETQLSTGSLRDLVPPRCRFPLGQQNGYARQSGKKFLLDPLDNVLKAS